MTAFMVFIFGSIVGSFLNVCIHRMPREESIVSPGSHCPHCAKPIAWYDNIPLLSFLILRGRCRHCPARISGRYFAVELANALIWLGLWLRFGTGAFFYAGAVFFSILLAVTMTDFETGYIPDKLSLPGCLAGLVLSAIFPVLQGRGIWYWGLWESFKGLLGGGAVLILVGWVGEKIFKKESMGGGDVKLLAMMGAFLGLRHALLIFFVAPFAAIPFALHMKFFRKAETIPYGPFLAVTGAAFYVAGDPIARFIMHLYGVS